MQVQLAWRCINQHRWLRRIVVGRQKYTADRRQMTWNVWVREIVRGIEVRPLSDIGPVVAELPSGVFQRQELKSFDEVVTRRRGIYIRVLLPDGKDAITMYESGHCLRSVMPQFRCRTIGGIAIEERFHSTHGGHLEVGYRVFIPWAN